MKTKDPKFSIYSFQKKAENGSKQSELRVLGLPIWSTKTSFGKRETRMLGIKVICRKRKRSHGMTLGVSYNLYDGEELLEASIKSIRNHVDYINVVYQNVSNTGEKRTGDLADFLKPLLEKGLIDSTICYTPNLELKANKAVSNETLKRVIGMRDCKRHGCTHFISMDVDEFFRGAELESAKRFINEHNINVSAVSIIEYLKYPTVRLFYSRNINALDSSNPDEYEYFMPFICKIPRFLRETKRDMPPCFADPTRFIVKKGKFWLFPKHEIAMHHMSTIRHDLDKKYRNSSCNDYINVKPALQKLKESILQFEPEKHRSLPNKIGFLGNFPFYIVDDEFGIGSV